MAPVKEWDLFVDREQQRQWNPNQGTKTAIVYLTNNTSVLTKTQFVILSN